MPNLLNLLNDFATENLELYNEFGIQFELTCFLKSRKELGDYKIQLERSISYFGLERNNFLKKEMNIVVFPPDKQEKHCIELKFPTNGQVPEQMFSACKNIKFLEQLVQEGNCNNSYFTFFTRDHNFFEGNRKDKLVSRKETQIN